MQTTKSIDIHNHKSDTKSNIHKHKSPIITTSQYRLVQSYKWPQIVIYASQFLLTFSCIPSVIIAISSLLYWYTHWNWEMPIGLIIRNTSQEGEKEWKNIIECFLASWRLDLDINTHTNLHDSSTYFAHLWEDRILGCDTNL